MEKEIKIKNEVENDNKKSVIVPAYKKNGKNKEKDNNSNENKISSSIKNKKNKKDKKSTNLKVKSKISLIIILIIFLLLFFIGITFYLYLNNLKYNPYKKYEENMKNYEFSKIYDNGSCNTKESVTKSEAVKIVIATTLNTADISGMAKTPKEEYKNGIWVEYAQEKGIVTKEELNKDNVNEKATYLDVIRYFANAKMKLLGKELDTEIETSIKDYEKYRPDEKQAIADAFFNGIIVENKNKLNGYTEVFKGQINEIVKNYVEKYNTITSIDEKLNIDSEKKPSNLSDYPYTLSNIEKSIYEKPFKVKSKENFKKPIDVYADKKSMYDQITYRAEGYYTTLLNIDYRIITEEDFSKKINQYIANPASPSKIKEYVAYIKENKIRIEGSAKNQAPIFYFDGENYRLRLKIDFKILYSDTKENLFYRDFEYKDFSIPYDVLYEKEEYSFYIDVIFSETISNKSLYIIETPLFTTALDKHKFEITLKEIGD